MTIPDHILDRIIPIDDGDYVFFIERAGFFRAHELREIADELDRRNEAAAIGLELTETAVVDGMHRYVFERAAALEIPDDGCCSGRSPCPVKEPESRPGAFKRGSGVFCGFCSARLNVKVPPRCPDCGKDLT